MIDCGTIIRDSWDITRRDVLFSADRDTEVQRYLDNTSTLAYIGLAVAVLQFNRVTIYDATASSGVRAWAWASWIKFKLPVPTILRTLRQTTLVRLLH